MKVVKILKRILQTKKGERKKIKKIFFRKKNTHRQKITIILFFLKKEGGEKRKMIYTKETKMKILQDLFSSLLKERRERKSQNLIENNEQTEKNNYM